MDSKGLGSNSCTQDVSVGGGATDGCKREGKMGLFKKLVENVFLEKRLLENKLGGSQTNVSFHALVRDLFEIPLYRGWAAAIP